MDASLSDAVRADGPRCRDGDTRYGFGGAESEAEAVSRGLGWIEPRDPHLPPGSTDEAAEEWIVTNDPALLEGEACGATRTQWPWSRALVCLAMKGHEHPHVPCEPDEVGRMAVRVGRRVRV